LLLALRELDCVVIAYMHDCYLISGRCAYPGSCSLYEKGCDHTCPTWREYPALEPSKIRCAWTLRRQIFCGDQGVPLATNSQWTLQLAKHSLDGLKRADVVYLGLDEQLFKPIDRIVARRLLGIPEDRFVILSGAINVGEKRKAAHFFREVVASLGRRAEFLVFGQESLGMKGVRAAGLLRDFRKMPILYSASNVFVGTALEEAFGQTLCEAAACGVPVVAFDVGGVPEVAPHNVSARLTRQLSAEGLLNELEFFLQNPDNCRVFGTAGRSLVESQFTLQKQGQRWMNYLLGLAKVDAPLDSASAMIRH
jgi:glycosyltransferase involved in cell wall biosynthesis